MKDAERLHIQEAPRRAVDNQGTAAARLEAAQAEKARETKLLASGASSERDVEVATANVDNLEVRLADAGFDLEQTTVRAPTDGYVTQLVLRPV